MHRVRVVRLRWTIAVILLLSMTASTLAQDSTQSRSTDWSQRRIPRPGAMLGIDVSIAKSSLSRTYNLSRPAEHDSVTMKFGSEPRVTEVDSDGPSAGVLRPGDVIVAIDNLLITSELGGYRYANLVPGEPVDMTIRRSGRITTVTIVPSLPHPEDYIEVPPEVESGEIEALIDTFVGRVARARGDLDFGVWSPPSFPVLGMDLLFDGQSVKQEDGSSLWRFDRPPRITAIEPGGPADLGGLRVDDIITHIDGTRLDRARGGRKFSTIRPGQRILWTVQRSGRELQVEITAADRPRT